GCNRTDLTFYRQKGWAGTGIGADWATKNGIPIGWTHTFVSSAALVDPAVTVRHGRLAADGPAYKAMIITSDFFSDNSKTLTVEAAQKIAEIAQKEFPIIFVGDWSEPTADGKGSKKDDNMVAEAVRTA